MGFEDLVLGVERVIATFGRWPSFHDAEVVWVRLDRKPASGERGPTLEAMIHAFEITDRVAPDSTLVLENHVLIHLRFHRVVELELGGLNEQNVLFGLYLTDIRDRQMEDIHLGVELSPSWGLGAAFQCRRAEVVGVGPCDKDGNPISP